LEFLNGQPWDQLALNYIMALRPSRVRVTGGVITADWCPWRVTVYVNGDRKEPLTIRHIMQEVDVGLDGGYEHGHALGQALKKALEKEGADG
jgi:hypothetical protein